MKIKQMQNKLKRPRDHIIFRILKTEKHGCHMDATIAGSDLLCYTTTALTFLCFLIISNICNYQYLSAVISLCLYCTISHPTFFFFFFFYFSLPNMEFITMKNVQMFQSTLQNQVLNLSSFSMIKHHFFSHLRCAFSLQYDIFISTS